MVCLIIAHSQHSRDVRTAICAAWTTIGWPEEGGLLCATWPAHRGNTEGCPVAIRSFTL